MPFQCLNNENKVILQHVNIRSTPRKLTESMVYFSKCFQKTTTAGDAQRMGRPVYWLKTLHVFLHQLKKTKNTTLLNINLLLTLICLQGFNLGVLCYSVIFVCWFKSLMLAHLNFQWPELLIRLIRIKVFLELTKKKNLEKE